MEVQGEKRMNGDELDGINNKRMNEWEKVKVRWCQFRLRYQVMKMEEGRDKEVSEEWTKDKDISQPRHECGNMHIDENEKYEIEDNFSKNCY